MICDVPHRCSFMICMMWVKSVSVEIDQVLDGFVAKLCEVSLFVSYNEI